MKKITFIIGFISALITVTSAVFKINHYPYAGEVLVVGLGLLSLYFPLYILDKMSDGAGGKTLPVHIVAAICAAAINLGLLFKLEHWPGASILLTIGLGGFSLLFVPMWFVEKSNTEGSNKLANVAGALGLTLFALGILFKFQHWPGAAILLVSGPALMFLIYFTLQMTTINFADEKTVNSFRETFFVIIIACFIIWLAMGVIAKRPPPPAEEAPVQTEQVK
jgi:hypothetical protein